MRSATNTQNTLATPQETKKKNGIETKPKQTRVQKKQCTINKNNIAQFYFFKSKNSREQK